MQRRKNDTARYEVSRISPTQSIINDTQHTGGDGEPWMIAEGQNDDGQLDTLVRLANHADALWEALRSLQVFSPRQAEPNSVVGRARALLERVRPGWGVVGRLPRTPACAPPKAFSRCSAAKPNSTWDGNDMKHNANLVIRLPADLRDTVNQLAVSHSCSVAEVVRMLIAMGCSRLRSDVVPPEGAATDVGHHSPDQET